MKRGQKVFGRGRDDAYRFWARCRQSGDHLIWPLGVQVRLSGGRRHNARRVAWILLHGESPPGCVVGACGVPGCVAHLRLDSMAGASRMSGSRKLTVEQVRRIRSIPPNSFPGWIPATARALGIHPRTITRLRLRRYYSCLYPEAIP